jgi:CRP-like cAMP-binding protein
MEVTMPPRIFAGLSRLIGSGGQGTALSASASVASDESPAAQQQTANKIAYLTAMRIFRDLSKEEVSMIEKSIVMTTAKKGKLVYMPGEATEVLFLLKTGSIQIYRLSSEGRKFIIETVKPMTFFGEMPSVGQNMQGLFAEAAEDSLVCVMGRADVERLILSKPKVGLRMMQEIGQRLHSSQEKLGDSAFKGIPARVATLLLSLSLQGKQPIEGIGHQDLADMIGVYRETVTNALGEFKEAGLIDLGRKRVLVVDPEKLTAIAEEEVLRKQ